MRSKRTIIVFTVLALMATGCAKNPFSTRRPENPTGAQGTYFTPVDPQIALDSNLYYAMVERNAGHYSQTLADTFAYVFDYVLAGPPDSALGWDRAEEDRIIQNLFAGATDIAMSWLPTPGRSDRYEDSLATLYRTYEMTVSIPEQDESNSFAYKGDMIVQLARNPQGLWWIVHWEDLHQGDGAASWADLKSRFR